MSGGHALRGMQRTSFRSAMRIEIKVTALCRDA